MKETLFLNTKNFILATRDSGYKNTASALAELIDNSIEAYAKTIWISINKTVDASEDGCEINVCDNGSGMSREELKFALQFGGSSRFNSRLNLGRFGMGLLNGSLSQCKRIEIITWQNKHEYFTNCLDVDEVISNDRSVLPEPVKHRFQELPKSKSGTIVIWKKCDRLLFKYRKSLIKQLHNELGRIYRYSLWRGVIIYIGEELLKPFDPLYVGFGTNPTGGRQYGDEICYRVKIPDEPNKIAKIYVRFVELPVELWNVMSNEEKRRKQITKRAGVSVLRAEREIDYGWYFMGDKRRENYDDWWRCEIRFMPELDELFGVTHTKQVIKETEFMREILTPDIERIARTLNNRVRLKFIDSKSKNPVSYAKRQLERTDLYLPEVRTGNEKNTGLFEKKDVCGYEYIVDTAILNDSRFFSIQKEGDYIRLTLNREHIFFDKIYDYLQKRHEISISDILKILEIILFSAGRAELQLNNKQNKKFLSEFMIEWSNILKTFCS